MTKKTKTPVPKRGPGQPPKERQIRYPIRIHGEEREAWRVAAARCGMQLLDWIPAVLNGEAKQPTHVKPLEPSAKDACPTCLRAGCHIDGAKAQHATRGAQEGDA